MALEGGRRGGRAALVICLAALYFVLAMGVALLGANLYRATAADAQTNAAHRVALSYVANQVRRGDAPGLAVGSFEGYPALRLRETTEDGSVYFTLIYCCDGQLRELYMEQDAGLAPEDGISLLPLEGLDFSVSGGMLVVTAQGSEREWSVTLSPRTGIEEVGAL